MFAMSFSNCPINRGLSHQLLAAEVSKLPDVSIVRPVDANAVFAIIPEKAIAPLQELYPFYVWDEKTLELRWMCSFDTQPEDVFGFIGSLKRILDQVRI